MSPQSDARARIRNEFGTTVAQKASDAFVEAYAAGAAPFGLETATVAVADVFTRLPTVLEMGTRGGASLDDVNPDSMRAAQAVVAKLFYEFGDQQGELFARSALRRRVVEKRRDAFLGDCGDILDELNKASGGPLGVLSETVTLRSPGAQLVEACWLNDCVRTAADARTVATVADDPRVQTIDVPRRLVREIGETADLVGAPAFRRNNHLDGAGVIVAVIDSEVSRQHPAFGGRVIHQANFTKEPWGHPDSHGTAVAGIIGSANDPLSGMAPGVTIYNYKVLATVDALNADDFGGAMAIQRALEDGAHVANCSWGSGRATNGTSREARACNAAWALGLVIVKSAGNRGPGVSTLTTPADADGIIVVGATDRQGSAVASYSSRGPFTHANGQQVSRPHLVAPGGVASDGITSCVVSGGFGVCGHGTSFAAPHVTGLVALLLSLQPDRTPDEVRADLVARCRRLGQGTDNDQGAGLLTL